MKTIAGNSSGAGGRSQNVGQGVQIVADGQKDERALGVFEPSPIDAKRQDGEEGRNEANTGPRDHPGLRVKRKSL